MAREQADGSGQNTEIVEVPLPKGQTMQMHLAKGPDYGKPHKDDDNIVPEFVNISPMVQIVRIPFYDEPHEVPPAGILRGAQWRLPLAKHNRKLGGIRPKFIEREKTAKQKPEKDKPLYNENDHEDQWSPDRGTHHDHKYLLTEEQMIKEIEALSNVKRIRLLIDNAVIVPSDDVTRLGYRRQHQGPISYVNNNSVCARPRAREDRPKVTDAASRRRDWIEEQEREAKEAQGIFEE